MHFKLKEMKVMDGNLIEKQNKSSLEVTKMSNNTILQYIVQFVIKQIKERGSLIGLILLCITFTFLTDKFLNTYNMINVARQSAVNIILAVGMTMVILTGGIDLSVGAVLALVGTFVAGLLSKGTNLIIALMIGLIVGTLFGIFNGLCVTKAKIPPFITTLGSMVIARSIGLIYSGGYPITGMPKSFTFIGSGYIGIFPTPVIIASVIFILGLFLLNSSIIGRYIYAIGGNEEATFLSGVNVDQWKIIVYGIAGFLTGLAGIVLTARMNSGQPTVAAGIEMDIIAAVVIGGTSLSGGEGNLMGTLFGTLIITVLNNGLTLLNVSPYYQGAIIGIVILLAVWLDRKKKS
ncbi:MAG: ribose transport system permease protein [Thermoanaerobacteraceae bacterium]|jgi:ribose transport system permease protein|nr:ribose transport system permease protein [Thermoanaerobacteraceae bacterium]